MPLSRGLRLMIDVLFFARIREQLSTDKLVISLTTADCSVAQLRQQLIDENGENWQQVLCQDNIVKAVNQQVVEDDHRLVDGDELAFFPPVTGG